MRKVLEFLTIVFMLPAVAVVFYYGCFGLYMLLGRATGYGMGLGMFLAMPVSLAFGLLAAFQFAKWYSRFCSWAIGRACSAKR